jgi:methylenetetrahydrofolate reductase (NADPH)
MTTNGYTNGVNGSDSCSRNYVRLIEKISSRTSPFFSLEFFPPRTKEGAINLFSRFDRLRAGGPLFVDITWHAASNIPCEVIPVDSIDSVNIAGVALNYCGLDTVLHITCVGQKKECMDRLLQRVKGCGIRNLLILRGDKPDHVDDVDMFFKHPIDLIRFIKTEYGDFFTIAVAGYPSGHPESDSYSDDLFYLKGKVEAGAHFVITQLFFEASAFIKFVKDCRQLDINVPILPGLMPIQSYESLKQIVKLSKLQIPQCIIDSIIPIKDNDEAIRNFGIDLAVKTCQKILASDTTLGLHFYTLNREVAVVSILEKLGMWNKCASKILPWPLPANHRRCSEDVRPIFWSSRPKSYVYRTQTWDEFPNGRWGRSSSPAFGELKDYYLFVGKSKSSRSERLKMWGLEITCEQDIWDVFASYLTRKPNRWGNIVTSTPWNEDELMPETAAISEKLAFFNSKGFLTINSQPNINGIESTDPVHGWGSPHGYVYQKVCKNIFWRAIFIFNLFANRLIWNSSHVERILWY